jgi:hypothetical protein
MTAFMLQLPTREQHVDAAKQGAKSGSEALCGQTSSKPDYPSPALWKFVGRSDCFQLKRCKTGGETFVGKPEAAGAGGEKHAGPC